MLIIKNKIKNKIKKSSNYKMSNMNYLFDKKNKFKSYIVNNFF